MKVLHVEAGRHLYGGALQVCFLLRGLRERGVDNVLACPAGSAIAQEAAPFAQVLPLPMQGDLDVGLLRRLRSVIRSERPDIVHLHSRRGIDLWGALAARLEGVPVVLSRRVDNPEPRWWVAMKYKLYDHVIPISQGIRKVLLAEGVPQNKLSCVPSAVDVQQYHPTREHLPWFRQEFALHETDLAVGMVAQFIERKGHRTLLQALPLVLQTCPRTQVLLFGQGPELENIRQVVNASTLLREHVVLAGFRRDLNRVLPCLDVLVHPAYMEGLGVSLLQAAACGVPLIGTHVGGIPEIVQPGFNGELIPPGDPETLAHAMIDMLKDPNTRLDYGRAGRQWVERHFSIAAMVAGNMEIYRRLLAGSAS